MKGRMMALVLAVAFAACGGAEGDQAAEPELTRAQKDSIVADLPIPGAGGVGRALEARDRANARTSGHDTIR